MAHPVSRAARIAALAIGFRLLTALLAFLANVVFPLHQREQFTVFGRTHHFWDTFARYDSGWYNGIARDGYAFVEGGRSNLAFFPVYPLLMRAIGDLFGGTAADYYLAGILISWTAFAAAMILLDRLARLDLPEDAADRAVIYAAIFPFAFFYGVVYTESLFLLLTLLAVYGFRTRAWALGGLAGALASATRVNGILALPALAWLGWRSAGRAWPDRVALGGAMLLAASGLAVYSGFVYSLSGHPLEWAGSIRRWEYDPGGRPWAMLSGLVRAVATRPYEFLTTEREAPYNLLNGAAALLFVMSIPFVWLRLGAGYGLFMLVNLWVPLSTGSLEGLGRYCSVLFPFFVWLASFRPPGLHAVITVSFAMLYMLCLALFTTIHPIF